MKKVLFVCLSLALAVSAFAGGRRQSSTPAPATSRGGGPKYPSLPYVTDGKTKLSMIIVYASTPTISSFDVKDNLFTQKIVRETGIQLDIINLSGPDATTRLNVMLSTNDYGDVIDHEASLGDLGYWANQGILQPLDQYVNNYPNTKALLEQYPFLLDSIRAVDGKIYALPTIQECIHCLFQNRLQYHMPWIRDKYGNKTPTTLDEFTAYLRFIRDNDINGNGNRNDEVPLAVDSSQVNVFIAYFASSFFPWVNTVEYGNGIANDNGRVVDQAKDPLFRETLRYLAGLYGEGLIAPNSFSMTLDEMKSLAQAEPPILATFPAAWKTSYLSTETPRQIESFSLKPLAGPQGVRYAAHRSSASTGRAKLLVTDKAKDPELAVALYDYLIDFEVNMDGSTGPKGTIWDYPDPGAVGMGGGGALYKRISAHSIVALNSWWDKAIPVIYPESWFAGAQTTGVAEAKRWHETGDPSVEDYLLTNPDYIEVMWNMFANDYAQYATPDKYYIPAVPLEDDDSIRISEINASLDTYKNQAWVEFITGRRNINSDSDWNAYLTEIDRYGSGEKTTILQKYLK